MSAVVPLVAEPWEAAKEVRAIGRELQELHSKREWLEGQLGAIADLILIDTGKLKVATDALVRAIIAKAPHESGYKDAGIDSGTNANEPKSSHFHS